MNRPRRRFERERQRERDAAGTRLRRRNRSADEPDSSTFVDELHDHLAELAPLGIHTPEERELASLRVKGLTISARRRRGPRADGDPSVTSPTVTLFEDESGVLRLSLEALGAEAGGATTRMRLRRARRGAESGDLETAAEPEPSLGNEVLTDLFFDPFPPNQIGEVLRAFDHWRAPREARGLRQVVATTERESGFGTIELAAPITAKRVRLIVHGTASSGDHLVDELATSADGKAWLGRAVAAGAPPLLVFNHATLSVSPVLNALDLAGELQELVPSATIDVVCHSRGGLVTRWWAESIERKPDRIGTVVFVGSPLTGTSLAAPSALKRFIEATANTARALHTTSKVAGVALPQLSALMALVGVLSRVYGVLAGVAAKTPVADVALSTIPGLLAMSRVENNEESVRLLSTLPQHGDDWYGKRYRYVAADFVPADPSWKIWKYLTDRPLARVVDAAADRLFPGPNDLVVDTDSMNVVRLGPTGPRTIVSANGKLFPASDRIHHVNYFQQPEVVAELERWLGE